ncbi:MAG: hypothetical protein UY40_C0020G0009 [candidate division CPR1 bacterium GW2011_GWC1_49_13]|uniref:Uncharacterized protein n=1 Tax=candidate division CPR1 bacterium GW2011_GWC1_49_13 TaxID=1618342 RepID=A0A0G1XS70_9BACT|nr:MAG: hypothetical protein UY40_C0020G0009 [candidate division CPR1 bacterium GW2011_GWC1_49_13]
MTRLARAYGQDVRAVWRWPYAVVLWLHHELEEVERIEAQVRALDDVKRGWYMALAFNDPRQLERVERELMSEIRAEAMPAGRAKATAERMIRQARRVTRGR